MSMEKLETGDPVKIHNNWSRRGKLLGIETLIIDELNETENALVKFDGDRDPTWVPLKDLVHLSYTWPEEWIPL